MLWLYSSFFLTSALIKFCERNNSKCSVSAPVEKLLCFPHVGRQFTVGRRQWLVEVVWYFDDLLAARHLIWLRRRRRRRCRVFFLAAVAGCCCCCCCCFCCVVLYPICFLTSSCSDEGCGVGLRVGLGWNWSRLTRTRARTFTAAAEIITDRAIQADLLWQRTEWKMRRTWRVDTWDNLPDFLYIYDVK